VHKCVFRSATPLCAGEFTCAFLFVHLHRHRACLVLRSTTPPPRSIFGEDDRGTCFCLSDDLIRDLLLISRRGSCLAFGFRATGLSTRRSSDGILLGDLRLISRRGSCLAFGFRVTGLSTRHSSDGILLGDLRLISRRGSCLAFGFRTTRLSTRRSSDGIFC